MESKNFVAVHLTLEYFTTGNDVLHCHVYENIHGCCSVDYIMEKENNGIWMLDSLLPVSDSTERFYFRFSVWRGDTIVDAEVSDFYHSFPYICDSMRIECLWNTSDEHSYRYSSAFTECLSATDKKEKELSGNLDGSICLFVNNFLPKNRMALAVVGSIPQLGEWNPAQSLSMKATGKCSYAISLPDVSESFEYKYILIDRTSNEVIWEDGNNRIYEHKIAEKSHFIEQMPRIPQENPRIAGVVIPVFSLRSEKSWGVGDFGDICRMVDWASSCHLHVLQVLPINDTTHDGSWMDSYPYNSISAFALHPMYADLSQLSPLSDTVKDASYREEAIRLNRLPLMDYESVVKLKNAYLKEYFNEHREEIAVSKTLKEFMSENKEWLEPYCAYRVLMKIFQTSDFHLWKSHSIYDGKSVMRWIRKENHYDTYLYYAWVQQLLDLQMKKAHFYAREKGVILKGDIPIGISRNSATAWANGRYFNFDSQAGAPPDYFSDKGQNWGFPTYNWEEILRDGGNWWKQRLQKMADYFDAYRIDHVLGFFRIWEIPYKCVDGTLGHFNPALPLTEKDIHDFGFTDAPQGYLKPMLSDDDLRQRFGDAVGMVKIRYFEHADGLSGRYTLKPQYLSGRQIVSETADDEIRSSLLRVLTEVLFIQDKDNAGRYHLNIAANRTQVYQRLSNQNRQAYDRMSEHYFFHRHDTFWTEGALEKLPLLVNATRMLPCAEDLGMIPECMRTVLGKLHILSLEVETMPKYSWGRFADVYQNPYLSVDTISTHDMQPLRLWWRENKDAAADYYWNILHYQGKPPYEMTDHMVMDTVLRHLQSPSMLCILALQDWMATDYDISNPDIDSEQINKPAVSRHYWRYRMHMTIEQLNASTEFTATICRLISTSGRR